MYFSNSILQRDFSVGFICKDVQAHYKVYNLSRVLMQLYLIKMYTTQ